MMTRVSAKAHKIMEETATHRCSLASRHEENILSIRSNDWTWNEDTIPVEVLNGTLQKKDQRRLDKTRVSNRISIVPTSEAKAPSPGAKKALEFARKQYAQTEPAIWYDSWGNDLRDNDLNGHVDDKSEQGLSDGSHYGRIYDAAICKDPSDTTDQCPTKEQSRIKVTYKVCIDTPIEAYKAAGVDVSTSRWIPTFFAE
jgi:hypothetical protein